ncbi:hypothetical protein ACOMHN_019734 [Nucella lapillus]
MSQFVSDRAYDYFDLGEESDQEGAESSEDEIDIILHGTPEQRRRLHQSHSREQRQRTSGQSPGHSRSLQPKDSQLSSSSSEDEFEKEMNAELDKTVSMMEKSRGTRPVPGPSAQSSTTSETSKAKPGGGDTSAKQESNSAFYSDIYFDSDDEDNFEGEGDKRIKKHHSKPSNDDLLYDPDMDEEDQRWIDQKRLRQHGGSKEVPDPRRKDGKRRAAPKPKSDAVLDCPACMTTLCLDCQRHDVYPNQFRAMFVMNCKVNHAETLSVPEQAAKKKPSKKSKKSKGQSLESEGSGGTGSQGMEASVSSSSSDQFHPLLCEECDTVVGVVDLEEVYHFFNVLVSQA